MSFIQFPDPTPLFPSLPAIGFPINKSPTWASITATKISGVEIRAARQCFPLWEFELIINALRDQTQNQVLYQTYLGLRELQLISQLFVACRGEYGEFYYQDPTDSSRNGAILATAGTALAPTLTLAARADGVATSFIPMRFWGPSRTQPSVDLTTWEPVGGIAIINTVYFDNVPIVTSNYAYSSNRVNFNSPPSAGTLITADLSFYYRCRFITDEQDFEQFMFNLWKVGTMKFRSVKP